MKFNLFRRCCLAGAVISLTVFSGCGAMDEVTKALTGNQNYQYISADTISSGLKQALCIGTENAVAQTSKEGGYWKNPALKIPLPQDLQKFADALSGIGLGAQVEALEKKMNEGAEMAAASASPVFVNAINNMTIPNAKTILNGEETGATDFFRDKAYEQLKSQYSPIISKELEKVGAVSLYNELYQKYILIPLAPKIDLKLEAYVTEKALDGLLIVVAEEEKKIRQDPAARTTELLKKVFAR